MPTAQLIIAAVSLLNIVEDTDKSTTMHKRRKLDDSEMDNVWVTFHKVILKMSNRTVLPSSKLHDKLISAFQELLFSKFPSLKGLRSTLSSGPHLEFGTQVTMCRYSIAAQTIGLQ